MKKFWEDRYSQDEYIYGIKPNDFFAKKMDSFPKGKLLLPCEGEGRNAVHAAKMGWEVFAFDASENGRNKALNLATKHNVKIDYQVKDALEIEYPVGQFDVIALIYAHFPESSRRTIHEKVKHWLKPGGTLILEAFNQLQLRNTSGGPKDISMLYSQEMLRKDFAPMEIKQNDLLETTLAEGKFHDGKADILRFVAIKI